MADARKPPLVMVIPPPLFFVLTFLLGFGLQQIVPLRWGDPPLAGIVAGCVLIGVAVLGLLGSMGLFRRSRTTILPHGSASALVTHGPYRVTRNPMYLSLTTAYLGFAALEWALWPLILLPLPLLMLQFVVIPFEEATLRRLFGATYDTYTGRVRRWL